MTREVGFLAGAMAGFDDGTAGPLSDNIQRIK